MLLAERRERSVTGAWQAPEWVCPACHGMLIPHKDEWICVGCHRAYPQVAGLPDLRIGSDRYLSLEEDRKKAVRLECSSQGMTALEAARTYYAMTGDVDRIRRDAYLAHLGRAEWRGQNMVEVLPRHGRVLEVGCGSGGFLVAAAARELDIRGVDVALRWLIVARRRLADRRLSVSLLGACAEHLPWPDGSFDAVVADSVLEHLEDPARALREWARVLRPGGRIFVWSPNRFSLLPDPHVRLWGVGCLPRTWARAYVKALRGCDWPIRPLSAIEARGLAAEAGFSSVAVDSPPLGHLERERSLCARLAIRIYGMSLRLGIGRWLCRTVGPIWQLTATRGEAA